MNYDKYTAIVKRFSNKQNITLESLTRSLNWSRVETHNLLEKLSSYGYPLQFGKNDLIEVSNTLDLYTAASMLKSINSVLKNTEVSIFIFVSIDSTNTYLKSLQNTENRLLICLTEQQTDGRGRRGKKWTSPFGQNVYMSMRKRVKVTPLNSMSISLIVGLSVVDALEALGYTGLQIKWPNDIYCFEKKLAGILIEVVSVKSNSIEVIIGIGLNVKVSREAANKIDQEWIDLSSASENIPPSKDTLVTKITTTVCSYLHIFEADGLSAFREMWKRYDFLLSKKVKIQYENGVEYGVAEGISRHGELLVKGENDEQIVVNAGEVSVRLQEKVQEG